jgi:hypothetical protein
MKTNRFLLAAVFTAMVSTFFIGCSESNDNEETWEAEIDPQVYIIYPNSPYIGNGIVKEIIYDCDIYYDESCKADVNSIGTVTDGKINLNLKAYTPNPKYMSNEIEGGIYGLNELYLYNDIDEPVGFLYLGNDFRDDDSYNTSKTGYIYYQQNIKGYAQDVDKNGHYDYDTDKYYDYIEEWNFDVKKGWNLIYQVRRFEGDVYIHTVTNKSSILGDVKLVWFLIPYGES